MRNKQTLAVIGLVLAISLLGFLIFTKTKKVTTGVSLDVVPYDALVTIDNRRIRPGNIKLTPGTHTAKVSRDGFSSQTIPFSVTNNKLSTLNIALSPSSQVGRDWLNKHPDQVYKAEGFGGQAFDEKAAETTQKNPLVSSLPFTDLKFRVDYGTSVKNPDDPTAVAIYIYSLDEQSKQDALDWIKLQNVDPATLEIIYKPLQ